MIIFSVSALDKSPVTLTGYEDVEFFELGEDDPLRVCEKLNYSLTAAKVSGGVLVSGSCTTAVCGICGRCPMGGSGRYGSGAAGDLLGILQSARN